MNEEKIKPIKAIVSVYNKVEQIKKDIDVLKNIRNSNTFVMTTFLAGDESIDNYVMSITSSNVMEGNNGELYQSFIDGLLKNKEEELRSYDNVLASFEDKIVL